MADGPIRTGALRDGLITAVPGARLTKTNDGFDVYREPFMGATSSMFGLIPPLYSVHSLISGLYLTDWTLTAGEGQTSELELVYTGFVNGVFPEPIEDTQDVESQASASSFDGMDHVQLTYYSRVSNKRTFTNTRPTSSIGATTPANCTGIWFTYRLGSGTIPAGTVDERNAYVVSTFFVQRTATMQNTREIVPGRYYENSETKQNLLFSIAA